MKQKRKVKSLLPKKNFVDGRFLTILLVVLSLVLCVGGVSLLTHSVRAQNSNSFLYNLVINYQYSGGILIYQDTKHLQEGETYTITNEEIQAYNPNKNYYTPNPHEITGQMGFHSDTEYVTFIPKTDENGDGIDDHFQTCLLYIDLMDDDGEYIYDSNGGVGDYLIKGLVPYYNTSEASIFEYETGVDVPFYNIKTYRFDGVSFPSGVPVDTSYVELSGSKLSVGMSEPGLHYIKLYYKPKNDTNGNNIPDEFEYTVNYHKCKEREPFNSITGVCEYEGENVNISIPPLEGYSVVKEGEPCEGGVFPVVKITYNPEKDQNNDCVWDGEQELWEITEFDYTGLDNRVEVLYGMRFLDPSDFTKVVNSIYMSGSALYIAPNPVIVNSSINQIDNDVYSHILGGSHNEVSSNNITLIAGSNNKVRAGNDNASILGGNGNEVMSGNGVPAILVGGESNLMGTGHDGNALIGGKNNEIEDGHSNVFILGGENNKILGKDDAGFDTPSENVIVGGKNVKIVGIDNVFVYSSKGGYADYFSPVTPNAFYLNVENGVGINTGGIEGLSVGGAVSVGRVNINNILCDKANLGVVGSYNGCLVGCTEAGRVDAPGGKREMLDQGNECAEICQNNSDHCLNQQDAEVITGNKSDAQCTEGVVNTGHAHLCIDDLGSYKNVIFESSLIDSDEECPNGQNICVYQCDEGYHLTGDRMTGKIGCYSDCKLPWDETKTIRHNETVVGYNTTKVECSNDSYIFPLRTNYIKKGQPLNNPLYDKETKIIDGTVRTKAKNGVSFESCGNYDHKKTLICKDSKLFLMDENGKPTGEVEARGYKYESCNLYSYKCNTGVYNLTKEDIISQKNDQPKNNNWEIADRGVLQGNRGRYTGCVDYGVDPNPTNNGESCTKGQYHYAFIKCQGGYSLVDDKCMKNCSLIQSDGNPKSYKHNTSITGYNINSVECPGVCAGSQLVCNDGDWRLGSNEGEIVTGSWYNYCDSQNKTCGSEFDVTKAEYDQYYRSGYYASCTGYHVQGNNCTILDPVYKLTGCIENYHTENHKWCLSNTKLEQCHKGVKPENSEYVIVDVSRDWIGYWDSGEWSAPADCKWHCNDGYATGSDGNSCVLAECGEEVNTCKNGISATGIGNDASGSWWKCGSKTCSLCNDGYHPVGSGDTPPYCEENVNGKCGIQHYECLSGDKYERGETLLQYNWDCLGRGNGTNDEGCFECKYGYDEENKECVRPASSCPSVITFDKLNKCVDDGIGENFNLVDDLYYEWNCGVQACRICANGDQFDPDSEDGNGGCERSLHVCVHWDGMNDDKDDFNGSDPEHLEFMLRGGMWSPIDLHIAYSVQVMSYGTVGGGGTAPCDTHYGTRPCFYPLTTTPGSMTDGFYEYVINTGEFKSSGYINHGVGEGNINSVSDLSGFNEHLSISMGEDQDINIDFAGKCEKEKQFFDGGCFNWNTGALYLYYGDYYYGEDGNSNYKNTWVYNMYYNLSDEDFYQSYSGYDEEYITDIKELIMVDTWYDSGNNETGSFVVGVSLSPYQSDQLKTKLEGLGVNTESGRYSLYKPSIGWKQRLDFTLEYDDEKGVFRVSDIVRPYADLFGYCGVIHN